MIRLIYLLSGIAALALGVIGLFLPLLPTAPFVILAAYCFGRSNPKLERRLLSHRRLGPHIHAWRSRGAISRSGKRAALLAFIASAAIGFLAFPLPWSLLPLAAALIGGSWIMTRPHA
jgi:hypothetical protein